MHEGDKFLQMPYVEICLGTVKKVTRKMKTKLRQTIGIWWVSCIRHHIVFNDLGNGKDSYINEQKSGIYMIQSEEYIRVTKCNLREASRT